MGDQIVAVHGDTVSAFPAAGCALPKSPPTWIVTVPFGPSRWARPWPDREAGRWVIQHDVSTGHTDVAVDWHAQLGTSFLGGQDVHLAVAGDSVHAVTMSQALRELQVFDATNAPSEYVGEGEFEAVTGLYTDESGITIQFSPVDWDQDPPAP